MKINQKKAGVLLTYLAQGIHIVSGLLYTPIMLRQLGQSEYGLYQLVASVVSYLSVLSLGFNSSYMRFYTMVKKQGDEKKVASFNGMFMTIFLIIAVICLLCGGVMLGNIQAIFGSGLTEAEYAKAKVLLALMVFNLAMTFPASVYDAFMVSHERFLLQKMLRVLQYLFNPFITLPLLIMGYGSVAMVLVTTGLTMAKLIASIVYCMRVLHIKMLFRDFQLGLLKDMWVFTFFIFINMVVDQINWSVDKFLLGRFSGTVAVAVYGIGSQLNNMYLQVSTAISNVFVPQVNRLVVEDNDDHALTQLFTKVGRVQFIILSLAISGFIFLGKPFIKLWAGANYAESYGITLLLIVPVTVPLIQNLGIEIQRAKNLHRARSVVYFFIAISNVLISIPFIKLWGPTGAALGTALSLIAGNCIFMNVYYQKKMGLDMIYFWKQILKFVPALIIPTVFGIILRKIWNVDSLGRFFAAAGCFAVVFCVSMWCLGMNDNEKNMIIGPLKRIYRKSRG